MKKLLFFAMTVGALGFCGYRLSTHVEAAPANRGTRSPVISNATLASETTTNAAIEQGRLTIQNLERELLSIVGSAKKTRGLTLYVAGQTDAEEIRNTTLSTVKFALGFNSATGENRKAWESVESRVTTAIDAALPSLVEAARAAEPEQLIAANEKQDVYCTGLKPGETVNIFVSETLPAHIKKAHLAQPRGTESSFVVAVKGSDRGAEVTLWNSESGTGQAEATLSEEDLVSKEAIEKRIGSLISDGALPKLNANELEICVKQVYGVTMHKKGGARFEFDATGGRSGTYVDYSGISRVFSPLDDPADVKVSRSSGSGGAD